MGVATVGEVLRLPRQGFVKRFGAMCLVELDRALGKLPDPRVSYRAPERFITDFDLNEEQDDAALLLNACRELLARLERFLIKRQLAVQHIEFSFFHLQVPATHLELGCVQADRAVQHWFDLLEIRFERLEFPAPVIAIRLCGGHGQQFMTVTETLPFRCKEKKRQHTSIAHLTERLSARMGDETVHGVMAVAEHRPQYAWQARSTGEEPPCCASGAGLTTDLHVPGLLADVRRSNRLILRRPLWVLEQPRLLEVRHEAPFYGGPPKFLSGPERLETGWWDDDGIARDYYVAVNPQRVHLWIFRDRARGGHWYLHGMFG
jgi:protein ImuB